MTLSDLSIKRPILTWMMTLALIVFGVLGYERLAIDRLPDMEFPVLTVTAELEGASPEGMEEDVTDVIEEQLNTIAGVRSLRSTTFEGAVEITVEFELGTDLDIAAQEVRDKVARVRRLLPNELEPPVVDNRDPNEHAILWIPFKSSRSAVETSEYVRRQMKPIFETIPGVAGVIVWGRQDRTIRIWLSGDGLRSRGLSAGEVLAALRREHLEVPGGLVESRRIEYSVKSDAEFRTLEELERLVVSYQDGVPVYLKDVGRVEDGAEDVRTYARYNGQTAVGLGILKQSGGNTVAIVDEVYKRLGKVREILPDGIEIDDTVSFIDFSRSIREAVDETQFTLAFGALLAVFTVFVFLRRTRPTLIIAAAIPISLVSTFGLVWVAGYSLNTMTLLGMTLAVGVVIDDAIIVLENIERHRELGEAPREAATKGTREIIFAASAATISVAAVFLPVAFVEGIVGNFMSEFGLTVAGSVMISLFVALTITPMLAARIPPPKERRHGSIYHRLQVALDALERNYKRLLFWTLENRAITIGVALAAFGMAIVFGSQLKSELFPPEDEGIIFIRIESAPGTAIDATLEYLKHDEAWFMRQREIGGLFSAVAITGPRGPARPNEGMMFGTLLPLDQRERSVHELILAARRELGEVPGRKIRVFNPAEMMRGSGGRQGELELEIRGNLPLRELDRISDELISALSERGGFVDLDKSLKLGLPELRVIPDREKAAALGVDAQTISNEVRMMIGGMDVGVFKEAGLRYDIRMRLEEEDRDDPASIGRLYVRARDGRAVELRNLIRIETGAAPSAITRSNRQRSVTIGANLDGLTLGEAIEEAFQVAGPILPESVTMGLGGQAESLQESVQQFKLALLLGLLVIYMVLAAQFESLFHALTVMLAVPLAMVGSLGGLALAGHTLNLFSVIGIILLFGLVTKNSILLVDFANQLREKGMDKREAIRTAAPIRMRPVLMTAIALIFAVLPAALGLGPGAESRAPMAIATGAGMFSSTLLTLIVVPVFYLLVDDAAEWLKAGFRRLFGSEGPAEPVTPTAS